MGFDLLHQLLHYTFAKMLLQCRLDQEKRQSEVGSNFFHRLKLSRLNSSLLKEVFQQLHNLHYVKPAKTDLQMSSLQIMFTKELLEEYY